MLDKRHCNSVADATHYSCQVTVHYALTTDTMICAQVLRVCDMLLDTTLHETDIITVVTLNLETVNLQLVTSLLLRNTTIGFLILWCWQLINHWLLFTQANITWLCFVKITSVYNWLSTAVYLNWWSVINWLSLDGSVVSSSGALILQSVNYTINGRMFTCFVNHTTIDSNYNETITVTVQGEQTIQVHSLSLNMSLQQHQLVMSLLSTHHHMLLMVTRMLSCSVLSHWVAPLDQTTVLSVLTGETALTLSSTTAPAPSHMGTHRSVTPSLVTWH